MICTRKIATLSLMVTVLVSCTDDAKKSHLSDAIGTPINANAASSGYDYETIGSTELTELNVDQGLSPIDQLMSSTEFSDPSSPLSKRTIYFEYDSSQVLKEFFPVIEAHAQYLMTHPNRRIVLEGHSDERGTREYNIALAEQRAKSVFKILQLVGVMNNQVDIVSYGEEKPAILGQNDESLALNRRSELVYQ